jgi:3-deoxy-manno-octulosonate cytidylyltransferase (CMP-KDO synthetase)
VTRHVLLVIPARLASTRLPRKMLLRETGKYLVQHVHERALLVPNADEVVVAADDPEIVDAVRSFGGIALLTSPRHPSGSDRVAEVARQKLASLVVNLQGDEPEIDPQDVARLIDAMAPDDEMGTLVFEGLSADEQRNPAVVKAVVEGGFAVDFRREPTAGGFRHVGIYAYRSDFLQRFTRLPPTQRERERRLEQMRALDHGTRIRAARALHPGAGIDTPDDYAAFVKRVKGEGVRA